MKIDIYAKKCVGCLYCRLMCSFTHENSFNPSKGRVWVNNLGDDFEISFAENCVKCGVCAKYCVYGALVAIAEEKGEA